MGLLKGKVAVVSGAARGQGRSHAIRLAEEGADIIAFDVCADVETVPYPLATPDELQETVSEVENLDRRIVATRTDVRDGAAVTKAIDDSNAVVYLASDLGRYVSGTQLKVDAGSAVT